MYLSINPDQCPSTLVDTNVLTPSCCHYYVSVCPKLVFIYVYILYVLSDQSHLLHVCSLVCENWINWLSFYHNWLCFSHSSIKARFVENTTNRCTTRAADLCSPSRDTRGLMGASLVHVLLTWSPSSGEKPMYSEFYSCAIFFPFRNNGLMRCFALVCPKYPKIWGLESDFPCD